MHFSKGRNDDRVLRTEVAMVQWHKGRRDRILPEAKAKCSLIDSFMA